MKTFFSTAMTFIVGLFTFNSCANIPEGAIAVKPFDSGRYLGKWYEIARLDFRYERGLNNTTANYSLNDDGTIKVVNSGYNVEKKEWQEAIGKAKFVGATNEGKLKVSFFGPFYSGYNVIALDDEYKYALIAGRSLDYLWILSREKTISNSTKLKYLELAKGLGYDTDALIWVEQDK
jgi:apolipoprotein D and lipocalin family protein